MRKKKAETDIILPNYNSYKYLDATIKSVISQTYKNWRLIIVDDASNQNVVLTTGLKDKNYLA